MLFNHHFLPLVAALPGNPEDTGRVMGEFVLQLAVIIIAARLGGLLFRRYLRLPRVIGELAAGMLIGPYAVGGMSVFQCAPLFPLPDGAIPVSTELYAIATFASIVLLFLAGLQTDLTTFLRYSVSGTVYVFYRCRFQRAAAAKIVAAFDCQE